MKIFFAILAVFAVASPLTKAADLADTIAGVRDIVPFDTIISTFEEWAENYASVGEVFDYFRGSNFQNCWTLVASTSEVQSIAAFGEANGANIFETLNRFADRFGLPTVPLGRRAVRSVRALGTNPDWDALIVEILSLYDRDALTAFLETQVASGGSTAGLWSLVNGYQAAFLDIAATPTIQLCSTELRALGVDIDAVLDIIRSFFGWV